MGYAKKLREMGIRAHAFNPYIPILSARLNNRDHRKLLIIDGKAAFTGGVNLADEYINEYKRFRSLEGLRYSRARQGRVVNDGHVFVPLGLR